MAFDKKQADLLVEILDLVPDPQSPTTCCATSYGDNNRFVVEVEWGPALEYSLNLLTVEDVTDFIADCYNGRNPLTSSE